MCSAFTSPFPTKSCVSGDVRFIQTWYGLYKPDCVFWIWPECQSQRLGFFDGSSNWGFTYTSYYSFSYFFDVNRLHTFYHVFVNPSPLSYCNPYTICKRYVIDLTKHRVLFQLKLGVLVIKFDYKPFTCVQVAIFKLLNFKLY